MSRPNFVARHLRGDLSLGRSLIFNGAIAAVLVLVFRQAVIATIGSPTNWPSLKIAGSAATVLLAGLVAFWQIAGTWRSAKRHFVVTGNRVWPSTAQAIMIVAAAVAVFTIGHLGLSVYSYARATYGTYRLTTRGATELVLTGDVARAVPAAVDQRLAAERSISVMVLESVGGTETAAWDLRAVIAAHGLVTRTETRCSRVCFVAFMAGSERVVDPGAQLGYYQSPLRANQVTEEEYLRSRGVTEDFLRRAQAVAPGVVWYPHLDELVAGHVVTGVRIGERVEPAEEYCNSTGKCS